MIKITTAIAAFFLVFSSFAQIRLPAMLASNMVLQQQSAVKLWGWSLPNEKIYITTSWDNKTDSVTAIRDAKWQLQIKTPTAGGPYRITFKGNNEIVLDNILIGEVWLCAGQSNMEFSLQNGITEIKQELPVCYNPQIRFCTVLKTTAPYPQDDCKASWSICDSNKLKSFSAIAYYYGKKLHAALNVPIGLISSNWGGTGAEPWTPLNCINEDTVLKNAATKLYNSPEWPITPGVTYNAMIAPITNYNIAGTIWYQGESNTVAPASYKKLFTVMMQAWRTKWGYDFPFYYVQIAPFNYYGKNTGALIQEAQTQSMAYKNVGMVVINDLVDNVYNVHPQNKHEVASRLANWALAETYHQTTPAYKSPVYMQLQIQKDKAILSFKNVPSILVLKTVAKEEIYIAGKNKIFYAATAKVDKDKLIVWCKEVPVPVAVRYAFSNMAIGNLFSEEGLPVTPFRTDDWPVDTGPAQQ